MNPCPPAVPARFALLSRLLRIPARLPPRALFGRVLLPVAALPFIAGCSAGLFGNSGPDYTPPDARAAAAAWQAPQADIAGIPAPHEGSPQRLAEWWSQFRDPALDALIAAAQAASGTLVQAAAAIERSRADLIAAGVAAHPSLDIAGSINRAAFTLGGPLAYRSQTQLGLQSSWEIDLFGALARQRESARAQYEANIAQWHEARVSLAAEVANTYLNIRYCAIQSAQAEADARSRSASTRAIEAAGKAGLQSDAAVALARASAAEAAAALTQRRSQCELLVKGLVALTAMHEPALRKLLSPAESGASRLPEPARFRVESVPARALAQRPDIAAAERRVAAASAEIGRADADRYPRLTLAGNILPTRISINSGPTLGLTTWSIGPSLLLPLLDGGRRAANVDAARAQFAAAEADYRTRVRGAVREVEEALVRLASAAERSADTATAASGYRSNLSALDTKYRAGLASLVELEDARRLSIAGDAALTSLEQERVAAWISLYRAIGGGWDREAALAAR